MRQVCDWGLLLKSSQGLNTYVDDTRLQKHSMKDNLVLNHGPQYQSKTKCVQLQVYLCTYQKFAMFPNIGRLKIFLSSVIHSDDPVVSS